MFASTPIPPESQSQNITKPVLLIDQLSKPFIPDPGRSMKILYVDFTLQMFVWVRLPKRMRYGFQDIYFARLEKCRLCIHRRNTVTNRLFGGERSKDVANIWWSRFLLRGGRDDYHLWTRRTGRKRCRGWYGGLRRGCVYSFTGWVHAECWFVSTERHWDYRNLWELF